MRSTVGVSAAKTLEEWEIDLDAEMLWRLPGFHCTVSTVRRIGTFRAWFAGVAHGSLIMRVTVPIGTIRRRYLNALGLKVFDVTAIPLPVLSV